MNTEHFKINEFPLMAYIMRVILFWWMVFATMKFEVNELFFGITIGIALVLLLCIDTKSIEATEDFVELKGDFLLSFMNKSEKIEYKDIVNVTYVKPKISGVSIVLNLINYVPSTINKNSILHFTLRGDINKELETFGSDSKNEKMIQVILHNMQIVNRG